MSDIQKVMCANCRFKIAMYNEDHVSINQQELYAYFFGGMAIILCKSCHSHNLVVSKEFEEAHKAEVEKAEAISGAKRAVFQKWIPHKGYQE